MGSLTINFAQIWEGGRRGLRPAAPSCFPGGSAPRPPKKALRALGCSGCSLSRDRPTCPGQLRCLGQNFFSEIRLFIEQATCPGQLRCLAQNCFQKFIFFGRSNLSGAASLPGAELFTEIQFLFWKKPLVRGNFAAWGRTFFLKMCFFLEQATCPGQLRCLRQNVSQNITFFEQTTCPGQLRCLGQFLKILLFFLNKPLIPGSFAAWGRTFLKM